MAVYIFEIKDKTIEQIFQETGSKLKDGEVIISTSIVDGKVIITTKESKNGSKKLLLG